MKLPPSIQSYFDADKRNQGAAPLSVFAPDAVVRDEGQSYAGHEAIDAWWRDVKTKYHAVAEPLEVRERADALEVRAKVAGQFPGSPVTLTFAFRLKDSQIAVLEIAP
jgi:hypothetical protein